MRTVRYHGREDLRVEDLDEEPLGPEEVRVEVAACGICGTDLHEYAAGPEFTPAERPHPLTGDVVPVPMGHEFGGVVVEVGGSVPDLRAGDPVAVNPVLSCGECRHCATGDYHRCASVGFVGLSGVAGGFAERVVVPAVNAVRFDAELPVEHAALVEPLAVGLHAVHVSDLSVGDSVAVFGAGPVGLATLQAATAAGAGRTLVVEPRAPRRSLAADLGADEVLDPAERDAVDAIAGATAGGVDASFEAAGVEEAVRDAVDATKRGGDVTVVGLFGAEVGLDLDDLVVAEQSLRGSLCYRAGPLADRDFGAVVDLLDEGTMRAEPMVTGRIGLDEVVEEGFEALLAPDSDHVKILVEP